MTERQNKLAQQLAKVSQSTGPAARDVPDEQVASQPAADTRRRRRTAGGRKPAPGESWDERVKRATFYVDRALLDELDAFLDARPDLNKSEFVREAIKRHLETCR